MVPIGVALVLGAGALLREVNDSAWRDAGAVLLPVGVVALVLISVARGARHR